MNLFNYCLNYSRFISTLQNEKDLESNLQFTGSGLDLVLS